MSDAWFVKANTNNKVLGPYSFLQIQQYVQQGKINIHKYMMSADNKNWQPLQSYFSNSRAQTIGKYQILHELGRGGMGIVYKAFNPQLKRNCAIKVLLPGVDTPQAVERFKTEAIALAKINHPNIVQVYEVHENYTVDFTKKMALFLAMIGKKRISPMVSEK